MEQEMPISEMEKILLGDQHVKAIHPAEEWNIPEVNLHLWTPEKKGTNQIRVERIAEYLNSPYIEDDFNEDHKARREWREKMEAEHSWFDLYYARNALKYGHFSGFHSMMQNFGRWYVGTNPDRFQSLRKEVKDMVPVPGEKYNQMPNETKMEVARGMKKKLYELLTFLSEQSPAYSCD